MSFKRCNPQSFARRMLRRSGMFGYFMFQVDVFPKQTIARVHLSRRAMGLTVHGKPRQFRRRHELSHLDSQSKEYKSAYNRLKAAEILHYWRDYKRVQRGKKKAEAARA